MKPFRKHHLLLLLSDFDPDRGPFDRYIYQYFRRNRAIGSKDRQEIADYAYTYLRWRGLIEAICEQPASWEERIECLTSQTWKSQTSNLDLAPHARVSFPRYLFDLISQAYEEKEALKICSICNETAPVTLRVNPLKATREDLQKRWKEDVQTRFCEHSPHGLNLLHRAPLGKLPEFREGLFEIQDEGSQCLANLVDPKPGDKVLDYCAGSGGKSLAFAHKLQGRGQIFLHDIRTGALDEAKLRLRRAGIQNAQILYPDQKTIPSLKKSMDWVLVDAPCSGTGTLRRNPDMKWRFDDEMLQELIGKQRHIFEKALSFVKPGGKIVYATCSLLPQENQQQTQHFLETYPVKQEGDEFVSLPKHDGWDGFYGVVLKKLK